MPDAVGVGNRVMRDRGWKHAWGIGRHLLGSQIFDYWEDPWGDKHEHYCDGDLFTDDQPTGVHPASRRHGAMGPADAARASPGPRSRSPTSRRSSTDFATSPDVKLGKLRTMMKIFG